MLPNGWTPIATTDGPEGFVDFAPYVASIDDRGRVAFQATLPQGHSGIFLGDGGPLLPLADSRTSPLQSFDSHPDIDPHSDAPLASVYATHPSGTRGVYLLRPDQREAIATTPDIKDIGPLGPTMNTRRQVAFRATTSQAFEGIFTGTPQGFRCLADTSDTYEAFFGLPVLNEDGEVLFRARVHDGREGIYLHTQGGVEALVESGQRYHSFGLFPDLNGHSASFLAVDHQGQQELCLWSRGRLQILGRTGADFESFRGILFDPHGAHIYYATPHRGRLGIYKGFDPIVKIASLGNELDGSTVEEFALNPVSLNAHGQIALRLKLLDKRQMIVRIDP